MPQEMIVFIPSRALKNRLRHEETQAALLNRR